MCNIVKLPWKPAKGSEYFSALFLPEIIRVTLLHNITSLLFFPRVLFSPQYSVFWLGKSIQNGTRWTVNLKNTLAAEWRQREAGSLHIGNAKWGRIKKPRSDHMREQSRPPSLHLSLPYPLSTLFFLSNMWHVFFCQWTVHATLMRVSHELSNFATGFSGKEECEEAGCSQGVAVITWGWEIRTRSQCSDKRLPSNRVGSPRFRKSMFSDIEEAISFLIGLLS